jgi:hypothetical protein
LGSPLIILLKEGSYKKMVVFENFFVNSFIEKLIGMQGARLLENEKQFSSCDVTLSNPSLSCGISGTGETLAG